METVATLKRIHQLPTYLANQIAAGEVIERPASVLKELLENSLDAKSTHIEITIERGGIGLIRVQDNGLGICKDDLILAIAPHATSKIETLSDLENVGSYGFRGEALASISAVSHLTLSSWVPEQEFGWRIEAAGRDQAPSLTPVPKRPGTIVEITDLFYNTPARRKFLRSEKTEMAYLEEVFKRIALSQPGVTFKFQQGTRVQKRLPACQDLEAQMRRVAMVCGESFIKDAYYIQAESNGLMLKGWLGSPAHLRSQADLQYFYVNNRIIRDKVVMHAIRKAYQEFDNTVAGRYPAYILYFDLDPTGVDVNVHPTKHEVRFREARTVHAFLSYAIQEGLKQGKVSPLPPKKHKDTAVNLDLSFLEFEKKDRELHYKVSPVIPFLTKKAFFLLKGELLLVENELGVNVIDVKATRRVLLQRQLMEAYQQEGVGKRPLLMPKSLSLGNEIKKLNFTQINWEHLGFEITEIGPTMLLIRSVPTEFSSTMENLTDFFLKLFTLNNLGECIEFIVDTILKNENFSEEEARQWLTEMQDLNIFEKDAKLSKFYKQMTIEQLRASLLF